LGRRRYLLVGFALAALLAGGCATAGGPWPEGSAGLRVVATTTQVADLVAHVGADRVDVVTLLKPGIDPHDYEPSPADVEAIAHAELVVKNGVGLESWLDDTVERSGFDGPVVDAGQGVRLRRVGGEPARAGAFQANLAAYTRQLEALDAEVERRTASLASRKVVTNHDSFGYYLDRYHLQLVGSVIPSFDSSAELSGRDIRETIGREAGVRVVTGEDALYGDTLGPPGSDGDTYVKMIRHNTRTIVSNLSGT
jgi:ABC-type Zn uptake system ZnuABC Zn-binding protein ZnuA